MQGVDTLAPSAAGVLPARPPVELSLGQVTEILNQFRRAQPPIENVAMRFIDMTVGGGNQYGEVVIPMHQLSEQLCMYGLKLSEQVTLVPELPTASILPNTKPNTLVCMAVQCSSVPDGVSKLQSNPYGALGVSALNSVLPAQHNLNNPQAAFQNNAYSRTAVNQVINGAATSGYPPMYMQGMQLQVSAGYQPQQPHQQSQSASIVPTQALTNQPSQQQQLYSAQTNPSQQQAFMYPQGAPGYPSAYAAQAGYMQQPPVHPYYAQQAYLNEYAYLQSNAQNGMSYATSMVPPALSAAPIDPSWPHALQPILAPASVLTSASMISPANAAMTNGNSHALDGSADGTNPSASMAPYASAITASSFDAMRSTKTMGSNQSSYASFKKSHKGTSCHQVTMHQYEWEIICKNTKPLRKLAFCSNQFNKRTKAEKRTCRKKYCDSCLRKFYGQILPTHSSEWICPSCTHRCVCAACVRHQTSKKKKKNTLTPAAAAALKELENAPPHVILGDEGDDNSQEDEQLEGDEDEDDDENSDEDDEEEGEQQTGNGHVATPNAAKREEEESAVAVLKQLEQSRSAAVPTPSSSSVSSALSSATPVPQLLTDTSNMSQSASSSLSTSASTSSQTSGIVKYAPSARRSRPSISEEMVLSDYSNTPLASPAHDLRTLSLQSGASTPSASYTSSAGSSPFVKARSISAGPTPTFSAYAKAPSPSLSRRVLDSHRAHPYSPSGLARMLPTVRDVASDQPEPPVRGFTSKKWKTNLPITIAANSQEQETAELLVSTAVAPMHDGPVALNSPTAGLREPAEPKPLAKTSPTLIASSPVRSHEEDVKMTAVNPNVVIDAVPPTSTVEV